MLIWSRKTIFIATLNLILSWLVRSFLLIFIYDLVYKLYLRRLQQKGIGLIRILLDGDVILLFSS